QPPRRLKLVHLAASSSSQCARQVNDQPIRQRTPLIRLPWLHEIVDFPRSLLEIGGFRRGSRGLESLHEGFRRLEPRSAHQGTAPLLLPNLNIDEAGSGFHRLGRLLETLKQFVTVLFLRVVERNYPESHGSSVRGPRSLTEPSAPLRMTMSTADR